MAMLILSIVALFGPLATLGSALPQCTTSDIRPTATVAEGILHGTTTIFGWAPQMTAHQYLGVPFAQSPPERFSPPQDAPRRSSPIKAASFKPSCIQQFPNDEFREIFNNPPLPESEDCLYLNVFTPPISSAQRDLPVMFWIHGGSFTLGSGRIKEYDGSRLAAEQDVIVVTINYRLNVFGFPASSALAIEDQNLGYLDQRKALAWVFDNVHAFGGDPSKITIFGESAGAYSVKQLVANPPHPLPFRAAILESQARGPTDNNEKNWATLEAELGCNSTSAATSSLACVRAASANRILDILNRRALSFSPTYDNVTDVASVEDAFYQGKAAKVPILIGTNADEGSVLTSVMPKPMLLLESIFGRNSTAIALARQAYPSIAKEEDLISQIVTDHTYTCTTLALPKIANNAGYKVWRYYFNASFPNNQPFAGAGVWHTSEIDLVFGTYPRDNQTTSQQVGLSRFMQRSWADFAKDPSSGPGWSSVNDTAHGLEVLGANGTAWGRSTTGEQVDGICEVYAAAILAQGI